jgi:hypothetical protein
MKFDRNFFIRQNFTIDELLKLKESARRDLQIAISSAEPEVKFHFSYMAMLKTGIYYISKEGYRIKSRPGHHQKIIEYLSKLLNSEDVIVIGDKMRKDRNLNLYSAGTMAASEEINSYIEFIAGLVNQL